MGREQDHVRKGKTDTRVVYVADVWQREIEWKEEEPNSSLTCE